MSDLIALFVKVVVSKSAVFFSYFVHLLGGVYLSRI